MTYEELLAEWQWRALWLGTHLPRKTIRRKTEEIAEEAGVDAMSLLRNSLSALQDPEQIEHFRVKAGLN